MSFIEAQVKGFLRAQTDANIISVSQNDNRLYCNSTAEQAIMDAEVGVFYYKMMILQYKMMILPLKMMILLLEIMIFCDRGAQWALCCGL